jgi:hypothetical protein
MFPPKQSARYAFPSFEPEDGSMPERVPFVCAALLAFAVLPVPRPAGAHHGGAVEWGAEELGPVSGIVAEFAFRFPHVQVQVDVEDADGATTRWTLVTRWTPTILRQHGWSRDSLKPGDTVSFTYLPHKESPTVGSIQSIDVNGEPLTLDF